MNGVTACQLDQRPLLNKQATNHNETYPFNNQVPNIHHEAYGNSVLWIAIEYEWNSLTYIPLFIHPCIHHSIPFHFISPIGKMKKG